MVCNSGCNISIELDLELESHTAITAGGGIQGLLHYIFFGSYTLPHKMLGRDKVSSPVPRS